MMIIIIVIIKVGINIKPDRSDGDRLCFWSQESIRDEIQKLRAVKLHLSAPATANTQHRCLGKFITDTTRTLHHNYLHCTALTFPLGVDFEAKWKKSKLLTDGWLEVNETHSSTTHSMLRQHLL